MNEVSIKEKRDVLKNDRRRMMYNGEPDISLEITKDIATGATSVAQMLESRLVGIRPSTLGGNPSVGMGALPQIGSASVSVVQTSVRAKMTSTVLVLVDGVPGDIELLLPSDVERVDMLRDVGKTSTYGIAVGDGKVVNILTKRGIRDSRSNITNRPRSSWQGYALEREFYSPKYDQSTIQTRPDYRATLYWNANVTTDKDGRATITFYNSDTAKKFNIVVESTDGLGNVGTGRLEIR